MRTLVLCPLKIELEGFLQALKDQGYTCEDLSGYDRRLLQVKQLGLIAGVGGHGKVEMALSTQKLLIDLPSSIETVCCLGTGGALTEVLKCLDVIVSEETIEHDYKSLFGDQPDSRPTFKGALTRETVEAITQKQQYDFQLLFAPVASGDEDVLNPERAAEIHNQTAALAVAWEGAGAARACRKANRSFIEVRGISDTAYSESGEDFVKNLPLAMGNATKVLTQLI